MSYKCVVCLKKYKIFDLKGDDHLCFKCLCMIDDFGSDIVKLKRAILYLEGYEPKPIEDNIFHGVNCVKAAHAGKHVHHKDDDTPFNVGSVTYCGRCHFQL